MVSTHSRPRAAGSVVKFKSIVSLGFNTQPPEGGWPRKGAYHGNTICFNTQPPEGGWRFLSISFYPNSVSTHSRPRAAGPGGILYHNGDEQGFQHTAARGRLGLLFDCRRPKSSVSTHSRPRAAGNFELGYTPTNLFQHTAARGRLARSCQNCRGVR